MSAVRTGRPSDGVASRHRTRADLSRRARKGVVTGCIESPWHGRRLAPRSGTGTDAAPRRAVAFRVCRASGAGGEARLETRGWAPRRSARSSHPTWGVAGPRGGCSRGCSQGRRTEPDRARKRDACEKPRRPRVRGQISRLKFKGKIRPLSWRASRNRRAGAPPGPSVGGWPASFDPGGLTLTERSSSETNTASTFACAGTQRSEFWSDHLALRPYANHASLTDQKCSGPVSNFGSGSSADDFSRKIDPQSAAQDREIKMRPGKQGGSIQHVNCPEFRRRRMPADWFCSGRWYRFFEPR